MLQTKKVALSTGNNHYYEPYFVLAKIIQYSILMTELLVSKNIYSDYFKVIEQIINKGCMVIPKMKVRTDKFSDVVGCKVQDHFSWRLSFSEAEFFLARSVPKHFR